jgi:hypothetical protein
MTFGIRSALAGAVAEVLIAEQLSGCLFADADWAEADDAWDLALTSGDEDAALAAVERWRGEMLGCLEGPTNPKETKRDHQHGGDGGRA